MFLVLLSLLVSKVLNNRVGWENNYAFIDSQNLNLGTSKYIYFRSKFLYKGWKLDYKKFRIYLKNKYRVNKAILFLGYIKQNEKMYRMLKDFGYHLVFKPTIKDRNGKHKGNVDAELVLYSACIEYDNYDKAVIVSGDGDFYCLHKYLKDDDKLKAIIIPNKYSESSLLREFKDYKYFLYRDKGRLERKRKNGRRHSIPRR